MTKQIREFVAENSYCLLIYYFTLSILKYISTLPMVQFYKVIKGMLIVGIIVFCILVGGIMNSLTVECSLQPRINDFQKKMGTVSIGN